MEKRANIFFYMLAGTITLSPMVDHQKTGMIHQKSNSLTTLFSRIHRQKIVIHLICISYPRASL